MALRRCAAHVVARRSRRPHPLYDYGYIHGNISSPAPYQYGWDYVADRQFWETDDKAPVPPSVENTNPIEGLFWQHADRSCSNASPRCCK